MVGTALAAALVIIGVLDPFDDGGQSSAAASESTVPTTRPRPLLSGTPEPVATTDPTREVSTTTEAAPAVVEPEESTPTASPRLEIDPVFDPVHDRLATTLSIPVRLPSELGPGVEEWVPTLGSVDANGYVVHLGVGDACTGASSCRVSTFTARKSNRLEARIPGDGTRVPLPGGLEGVFSDATCGSDCTNGFITWAEGNVLYSVGSRLGSGPEVLRLAWNAIDSSSTPPTPPEICGPGAPADNGRVARPISTEIADGRTIDWLLVCSADGTKVEILRESGDLAWIDLDDDGFRDLVLKMPDGESVVFAVSTNAPHAAIDVGTSSRLVIGELACADTDGDGRREAVDVATSERLDFLNPVTVRRTAIEPEAITGHEPC